VRASPIDCHKPEPVAQHRRDMLRLISPQTTPPDAVRALQRLSIGDALLRFLADKPYHRVAPLLAARSQCWNANRDDINIGTMLRFLDASAEQCSLRNQLIRRQLLDVVGALAERGIGVCLVKGAVSLVDTPPQGYLPLKVRPMEDIDLVVMPDAGEAAREAVAGLGCLAVSGDQKVVFDVKAPALVDVHTWRANAPEVGYLEREAFFEKSVVTTVGEREVRVLSPVDAVQFRLVHDVMRQHLFLDFPMLHLVELASWIRQVGDAVDWEQLRSLGLMHGISRIFDAALLRLRDELGAPVPKGVVPSGEEVHARRLLRKIDRLSCVPEALYFAAARYVLVAAMPGQVNDKLERAFDLLIRGPLRGAADLPWWRPVASVARLVALHLAVGAWSLWRG
jgi:hypothetical protein